MCFGQRQKVLLCNGHDMNRFYRPYHTADTLQWHYPKGLIEVLPYQRHQMEDLINHSLQNQCWFSFELLRRLLYWKVRPRWDDVCWQGIADQFAVRWFFQDILQRQNTLDSSSIDLGYSGALENRELFFPLGRIKFACRSHVFRLQLNLLVKHQ